MTPFHLAHKSDGLSCLHQQHAQHRAAARNASMLARALDAPSPAMPVPGVMPRPHYARSQVDECALRLGCTSTEDEARASSAQQAALLRQADCSHVHAHLQAPFKQDRVYEARLYHHVTRWRATQRAQ